jgi:hypothetical protein
VDWSLGILRFPVGLLFSFTMWSNFSQNNPFLWAGCKKFSERVCLADQRLVEPVEEKIGVLF